MKRDIRPADDVELLVDAFYGKVRKDTLLGPIFKESLQDDWTAHLNKMYKFWHTVLQNDRDPLYFGNPYLPHANLPHGKDYFNHWVILFHEALDQLFEGQKTEEIKTKVSQMAKMFHHNIETYSIKPKGNW